MTRKRQRSEQDVAEVASSQEVASPAKKPRVEPTTTSKAVKTPRTPRITKAEKTEKMKQKMRQMDWRDLDFIGMELKGTEEIYDQEFHFPEFERELESGVLSNRPYPLYIYMSAQPINQTGPGGEHVGVVNIPYIVVIDCAKPPCGRIALSSIQFGQEVIEPAHRFHLSWVPYFPHEMTGVVEAPVQLHKLAWYARKPVVELFSTEQKHHVSLLMPYELLPQVFDMKTLQDLHREATCVAFEHTAESGQKVEIVWDKEVHRLKIDLDIIIEDEKLDPSEKPRIEEGLRKRFEAAREAITKRYNEQKAEISALSATDDAALRNMKVYKFYPTHEDLALGPYMTNVINRYYGKATRVFPDLPELDCHAEAKLLFETNAKILKQKEEEAAKTAQPVQGGFFFTPTDANNEKKGDTVFQVPAATPTPAAPGFSSGGFFSATSISPASFMSQPEKKEVSPSASSGWKCSCCEAENVQSAASCTSCWANRS